MAKDIRNQRFTLLCNNNERQLISAIALRLGRSQAGALRFLIRIAAQELYLDLNDKVQDIQEAQEGSRNE
jgi:hypothetical protein